MRRVLAVVLLTLAAAPAPAEPQRVVSLGGAVTEIVVALGAEGVLVGRDSTSEYPPSVAALPDVGYVRALSPEGVLALNPDLILAEAMAGPVEAVDVLRAAGVDFRLLPGEASSEGVREKIAAVGEALDRGEAAAALTARFDIELEAVQTAASDVEKPRRVLFVLALQGGRVMAGGEGSSADAIIRLAGARNAATGFQGYKQMTDEAVLAAAPDVILMMDREGDLTITNADVTGHPALGRTPAALAGDVVRMDGMLLLGFGPRTPEAAAMLHRALYPAGGNG